MSESTIKRDQAVDTVVEFAHRNAADDAEYERVLAALRDIGVTDDEIAMVSPW